MSRSSSSDRGRDPIGHNTRRTMENSRRHSSNILEELANIEQALSMVSSQSTAVNSHHYKEEERNRRYAPQQQPPPSTRSAASQDWYSTHVSLTAPTPPRPSRRDPTPNNAMIQAGRSPLVRFSEQLEVYSKHISQGNCNAPTIPILKSQSSSSTTRTTRPSHDENRRNPTPSNNTHHHHPPPPPPPSSGGSRDPTPRAMNGFASRSSATSSSSAAPREPNGMSSRPAPMPSRKAMSDPPIDRSRRNNHNNNTNNIYNRLPPPPPPQPNSASRATKSSSSNSNDLELNPRRLAASFSTAASKSIQQKQKQPLRRDLAPTPTNREQAPTPNHTRINRNNSITRIPPPPPPPRQVMSEPKRPAASAQAPTSSSSSSNVWSMTSLFANPCQSPFAANTRPPLPMPQSSSSSTTMDPAAKAVVVPQVLNIPHATMAAAGFAASPKTPIRERTNRLTERWREQDAQQQQQQLQEEDSHTSDEESATELLIGPAGKRGSSSDVWED